MTVTDLLTQEVIIISKMLGGDQIDDYGNEIPDLFVISTMGCLTQQTRTEREGYVPTETFLLVLPANTWIEANDTVEVSDQEFQVQGDPWHVVNPRSGIEHHVEATIVRTGGGEEIS